MKHKLNHHVVWLAVLGLLSWGGRAGAELGPREAEASRQLVRAVNSRDYIRALEILHSHGVTNTTLEAMAARLPRPPARRAIWSGPFLKGYLLLDERGDLAPVTQRVMDGTATGYAQPFWVMERVHEDTWSLRALVERSRSPVAPIGVMNPRYAAHALRFFKWYDLQADGLHSVALNWYRLNNFDAPDHAEAYRLLNALFQLIKARHPDAFVWLFVEPTIDNSDLRWLQTMRFPYDGLLVGNLREFASRFAATRQRYAALVGDGVPMLVADFYGYEDALIRRARPAPLREAAMVRLREEAMVRIGREIAPQLDRHTQKLSALGYQGVILNWRTVEAVARARGVPLRTPKPEEP